MLENANLPKRNPADKQRYAALEIEVVYFGASFIRTSFGDDGNDDGGWGDENAKPMDTF